MLAKDWTNPARLRDTDMDPSRVHIRLYIRNVNIESLFNLNSLHNVQLSSIIYNTLYCLEPKIRYAL